MKAITETEVVRACRTLFGKDIDVSRQFLYYSIQPSGVKSAYRKKAKENHPDLFAAEPPDIQRKQTALFREIMDAYDVLTRFFQQRELKSCAPGKNYSAEQTHAKEGSPAEPSTPPSSSRNRDDIYYKGNVPHRTLKIGHYLYYRGKISFGALIKALIWQRKQRPSMGDIAVQWGWLDKDGVDRIFNACGKPRLFGEKAAELGLLTVFQVNTILLYQRTQQTPLGTFFIENGILKPEELEHLVRELKEHNAGVLCRSRQTRHRQTGHA
jgi:hypothetical protein